MGTHSYPALGFDPAPGNPETLESVSRTCTALGSDFGSDAHMLHRIGEGAVWEGEGGVAFDETAIDMSEDIDKAATAYGGVGTALWTYASALRAAQSEARAAEADAADAKRRAGNLQGAVDDLGRQIDNAPDDADTSDDEAARSRLQGRLSDANGDYDAAVSRAERAQGRVREAASAAARRINDLAGTRPYEEPGWFDRATSWVGDRVSDVAGAVDRFIDEHADLLRSISGVLKIVSAVAGVLSFIPILAPVMAPIAIATGAAALAIDAALVLTGNGDWKALLVDAALTVIPFGRVAGVVRRGASAVRRTTGVASRVDNLAAAADRSVDASRVTPSPVWRADNAPLWRADNRPPSTIFNEGFRPRDPSFTDLDNFVRHNTDSAFVSTSRRDDLIHEWGSNYRYEVDAPGGIDVNSTMPSNPYATEAEVAFPGGIDTSYIRGAHPYNPATGEFGDWIPNPNYIPRT